ncbi:MAG: iron-sulfur cluster assembly scaffold protein [Leptospiraceae bacterium]|nr:iron-sulfur cluster assembly scaffold protein [Leptospiraceae bacterium]
MIDIYAAQVIRYKRIKIISINKMLYNTEIDQQLLEWLTKQKPLHATHSAYAHNPLCGDAVEWNIELNQTQVIRHIHVQPEGCQLCKLSAVVSARSIHNRTLSEAQLIGQQVYRALFQKQHDDIFSHGELMHYQRWVRYTGRYKCLYLPWDALSQIS